MPVDDGVIDVDVDDVVIDGRRDLGTQPRDRGKRALEGRRLSQRGSGWLARSTATESEDAIALGFYFSPQSMSAAQYDDVIRRLEDAGQGNPAGRLYHVAFEGQGGLEVFDVWDSQESFDRFGQTLMPILEELGVDVGKPEVMPIHNVITG